ncbi:putative FmdB family regulatory protein [Arthrobacter sp. CAN_A212]|uniref:FmdB family zinc ribbon protein n=1 Tax=unclassified Arthrobacter TaxID=235627 RepID=UPI0018C9916F|nr:FmdB family zinc ribbon protein [Arthrobacter sp. CAN_C5]MBP2215790.1 putative FmdB family regulatory protein [Arthrobacter sp. CAN_C5]
MPTYAYACKDCDHAFDIHQAFSDNSLTECPECEGSLRKKFNSVGVVFKGSGFYRNDSRDSKKSVDPGTSSSSPSSGTSSDQSSPGSGAAKTSPGKDASTTVKKPSESSKTTAAAS